MIVVGVIALVVVLIAVTAAVLYRRSRSEASSQRHEPAWNNPLYDATEFDPNADVMEGDYMDPIAGEEGAYMDIPIADESSATGGYMDVPVDGEAGTSGYMDVNPVQE